MDVTIGPVDVYPVHPQNLRSADAGKSAKHEVSQQRNILAHCRFKADPHSLWRQDFRFGAIDPLEFLVHLDKRIAVDQLFLLMAPLEESLGNCVVVGASLVGLASTRSAKPRLDLAMSEGVDRSVAIAARERPENLPSPA